MKYSIDDYQGWFFRYDLLGFYALCLVSFQVVFIYLFNLFISTHLSTYVTPYLSAFPLLYYFPSFFYGCSLLFLLSVAVHRFRRNWTFVVPERILIIPSREDIDHRVQSGGRRITMAYSVLAWRKSAIRTANSHSLTRNLRLCMIQMRRRLKTPIKKATLI